MLHPRGLRVTASIMLCIVLQALGADKYTDGNRPYEFGFKIDGEQHRHESKDENGIIMGEFGFITADDVYHVTVYATDEQGRFKILSMKNIHLKSTPSSLGTPKPARQGHALALPPAPGPPGAIAFPPGKLSKPISIEPPGRSCSSCSLPTTTTQAPPPVSNQGNQNYNSPNQFGAQKSPQTQEAFPPSSPNTQNSGPSITIDSPYNPETSQQNYPPQEENNPSQQQNYPSQQQNNPSQQQNYPSQQQNNPSRQQNYPFQQQNYPSQQQNYPAQQQNIPLGQKLPVGELVAPDDAQYVAPQFDQTVQNYPGSQKITGAGPNNPASYVPDGGYFGQDNAKQAGLPGPLGQPTRPASYPPRRMGERTAKQYNLPEQQYKSGPNGSQDPGATKPMLVSAQLQIVDKNTDIYALGPNEQKGLPPGLNQNDMTQLLYTFNYTLGFHGHFEEGYTNGVKKGYYFVTGRNGVRTRIDYVADDTGFHPKVSKDVLDLLSEDVPKPETEKDDKYGLKGYEFKWLYYPVESKRP